VTTHEHASLDAALAHLRARGYRIAATDLGGLGGAAPPTPITQVSLERPLCVAFGNEHDGISEALRRACDERVFIPMAGFVESFNVSVACAVTLAELRRRHVATHGPRGDLAPEARQRLLDQWVVEDIPKARQVIAELARRATLPGPSASD
jgi:tRNA (guanosine-2'-O-)-methyltransferase